MDANRQNAGLWDNILTNTRSVLRRNSRQHLSTSTNGSDVDMNDIPPLEPITGPAHPSGPQNGAIYEASSSADTSRVSAGASYDAEDHDIDMPELQAVSDSDRDSMPDLHSISDSSDDLDSEDEVERMQAMQPVEDDHDSEWTDDDGDAGTNHSEFDDMPPLEPIQPPGRRRARVDDDQDEDRDRRHPSERTSAGTPTANHQGPRPFPLQMPLPFRAGGVRGLGLRPNDAPPNIMRFFEHMFTGAPASEVQGQDQDQAQGAPGSPPTNSDGTRVPNHPNHRNVLGGVATFTWTGNFNNAAQFGLPPEFQPPPASADGGNNDAFNPFTHFLQNIDLAEILGMREAPEDPERAKKLVEGLEVVPEGLVRRMERVGGAPGGHVDDGALGGSGCAICWDKLLDSEGDGFAEKERKDGEGSQEDIQDSTDVQADSDVPVAPSESPNQAVPPSQPKIVCLPCAHVFHASCLVPWFSRPRQTTCPTCRFNIDPENLTYVRRAPTANAQTGNGQPPTTDAQPAQAPQQPDAGPQNFQGTPTAQPPQQPSQATDQPFPQPGPLPAGAQPFGGIPVVGLASVIPPALQEQMLASLNAAMQNGPQPAPNANPNPDAHPGDHQADTHHHHNEDTHTHEFVTIDINFSNLPFHPTDEGNNETGGDIPPNMPPNMPDFMQQMFTGDMGDAAQPPGVGNPAAAGGPNPNIFQGMFFGAPPPPFPGTHSNFGGRGEKKQWSLPPAPGPTLRQRIEEKEREAGLRCYDMSCGVGPDDEDPFPSECNATTKQLLIRPLKGSTSVGTSVCSHTFHPACLVSAERVAGWGGEVKALDLDAEVSCPVCRAVGCVTGKEWQEGVQALS